MDESRLPSKHYAIDDAIFMGEISINNIKNLARILRCFHAASGLKVNFHKSRLFGIGISDAHVADLASILGCIQASLPFAYLGVSVGANMNLKKHWLPIIDRFKSKLSDWKAKHLSFGGRLTLVKSILNSLPIYFFSLFKAPLSILAQLERIRRRFLWGGNEHGKKIHWVSWAKVIAPKDLGGLSVGSLRVQNCSLLMKWLWKLRDNNCYLWKEVILAIHGINNKPLLAWSKSKASGVWNNICKTMKDIKDLGCNLGDFFSLEVGNGKKVRFWKDQWIGVDTLQVVFPSLFDLERKKNCCISDRVRSNGFTWDWNQGFGNQQHIDELCSLLHMIHSFSPKETEDKMVSNFSHNGSFIVGKARRFLDGKTASSGSSNMIWLKWIPLKVCCFVWMAQMGKIPVAKCLVDRGINIGSNLCKVCNLDIECANHALITCARSLDTFKGVFKWCDISFPTISSVIEVIEFGAKWGNCPKKRKTLMAIIQCSLWCIWKARNDLVFKGIKKSHVAILEDIISYSYLWIRHRSGIGCNRLDWGISPF